MPLNAAGEEVILVPNVPIFVPGLFSRIRFEPDYALPLIKYVWRNALADPADPVRIMPEWPRDFVNAKTKQISPEVSHREIPADDPARWEIARLQRDFGGQVFEAVYGATEDAFRVAFDRVLAKALENTDLPAAVPVV